MAELKIDITNIDTLVQGIKTAENSINTSVKSINNPSKCSGIMITTYVDRIKKISTLLDKYKQLLEKDAVDIVASKNKISEMDQKLTNLYQSSGGSGHGGGGGGGAGW